MAAKTARDFCNTDVSGSRDPKCRTRRMADAPYVFLRCHIALDEGKAKVTALRFKLAVTQALNTLFGEVGAALPVDLLGFDEPKQEAILRLPSKSRARLWSALMLITDFEKKPCRVQVLAVAGTLSQLSGSPEWPRAHAGHRRPPGLPASPPHLATA